MPMHGLCKAALADPGFCRATLRFSPPQYFSQRGLDDGGYAFFPVVWIRICVATRVHNTAVKPWSVLELSPEAFAAGASATCPRRLSGMVVKGTP